jgi:hypothetical protein
MTNGDRDQAIAHSKKSLILCPDNTKGALMLKKLRGAADLKTTAGCRGTAQTDRKARPPLRTLALPFGSDLGPTGYAG